MCLYIASSATHPDQPSERIVAPLICFVKYACTCSYYVRVTNIHVYKYNDDIFVPN